MGNVESGTDFCQFSSISPLAKQYLLCSYYIKKKKHTIDRGRKSMQDTDVFVIKLVMFASVFAHNKCVKGVLFVCEFLVLKHFCVVYFKEGPSCV